MEGFARSSAVPQRVFGLADIAEPNGNSLNLREILLRNSSCPLFRNRPPYRGELRNGTAEPPATKRVLQTPASLRRSAGGARHG